MKKKEDILKKTNQKNIKKLSMRKKLTVSLK